MRAQGLKWVLVAGATHAIVSDPDQKRRALAEKMGATRTLDIHRIGGHYGPGQVDTLEKLGEHMGISLVFARQ